MEESNSQNKILEELKNQIENLSNKVQNMQITYTHSSTTSDKGNDSAVQAYGINYTGQYFTPQNMSPQQGSIICSFCQKRNHTMSQCFQFKRHLRDINNSENRNRDFQQGFPYRAGQNYRQQNMRFPQQNFRSTRPENNGFQHTFRPTYRPLNSARAPNTFRPHNFFWTFDVTKFSTTTEFKLQEGLLNGGGATSSRPQATNFDKTNVCSSEREVKNVQNIENYESNNHKNINEKATQNVNERKILHIHNVYDENFLPTIKVKFGNNYYVMLIDSGSSVSLLTMSAYNDIKCDTKTRLLSRNVMIHTVNSQLSFSCCSEISFKIDQHHFKNPFYVANFKQSTFAGILGYDFLSKNNVIIDTKNGCAKFDNFQAKFISPDCYPKMTNCHTIIDNTVILQSKMILQPQESSIVKLCLKNTGENISEIFFQPTISSHDIEIHPALHTVKNSCFPTVIRNLGNTAIHFNKGQVFGEATPSFLLKTNENANDKNICGSPNNNTPMCNLITPSEDILKKRKDELSETDFKLEHLNSDQKQLLLETLLDRSAAFSKSLKTIGCTDRVIPTFNFRSHNPIKTLPFEIPHAIQGTIKEELNELIEAGLIHRNISQWSSPMVLVKKKQNPTNPHKPASYRMALDLRLLNTILENSTYPLPKIPT
ncbi:hypothetical protein AVEN_162729-1, partial [Araneus ventricosus]